MVSNTEIPLLARVRDIEVNRDAEGAPTLQFRIVLSAPPHDGFSYKTLKYGGISVAGGELRSTRRTIPDRDNPARNQDWTVTVQLQGEKTVVSFPSNDTARRSIYTEDGRMLANQTTITVPDPDGEGERRVQRWLR